MNVTALTGNLGGDPESFWSSEGKQVVTFSLAFKSSAKKTCWIKVTCFSKTAELAEKHLHKGAKAGVCGMLDEETWEGKDGKNHSKLRIIANSIDFVKTDGRGFENGKQEDEQ